MRYTFSRTLAIANLAWEELDCRQNPEAREEACREDMANNNNLGRRLRNLISGIDPSVTIHLNLSNPGWCVSDRVEGHVAIRAPCDTSFSDIQIFLVGKCTTCIDHFNTSVAAIPVRSKAADTFLRLLHPTLCESYPDDCILRAGREYTFPFDFTIPAKRDEVSRSKAFYGVSAHSAHAYLPPTLGDLRLQGKYTCEDDMAPEMVGVTYRVVAKITKTVLHKKRSVSTCIASDSCSLRVAPITDDPPEYTFQESSALRSVHLLKRSVFAAPLGTLVMESAPPEIIRIPVTGETRNHGRTDAMAAVTLRFEPSDGVTQPLRLRKLKSKINIETSYSTRMTCGPIPEDLHDQNDPTRRTELSTIKLASRCVRDVKWHVEHPTHSTILSERDNLGPADRSKFHQIPKPSENYKVGAPFHVAAILIPVDLPLDKYFIPTFDSCLISRSYSLTFSLALDMPGLGNSMHLRVPLKISTSPGR